MPVPSDAVTSDFLTQLGSDVQQSVTNDDTDGFSQNAPAVNQTAQATSAQSLVDEAMQEVSPRLRLLSSSADQIAESSQDGDALSENAVDSALTSEL